MRILANIKTGNEKYPALTGIRAMGATIVFFDHFHYANDINVRINVMAFFFVLSGFLIVRLYYTKVEMTTKSWYAYFINRFARIYPVYFLLLTIAIVLRHDYHHLLLLTNYTLTHALINNTHNFVIQPSWSLTVEECFYFLAPFIILIIRKKGFVSSLVFAFILLAVVLYISTLGLPLLQTPLFIFATTFFGHFAEFFAGIFLALVMMKKEKAGAVKLPGMRWTLLGVSGVVILIIAMGFVYGNPPINPYTIVLINNFLIPIPIAVLYYGLMCEDSLGARFLSGRFIGILGRSSYTFYLLHTIIIIYVADRFLQPFFGDNYWLCALFTYTLTYGLSILIFALYEEPLNMLIRKKFIPKNSAPEKPVAFQTGP